jgi:hypothetical protein
VRRRGSAPPVSPRIKVAHAAGSRLRLRIDTPRGQGNLTRLAEDLEQMPDTRQVRANHAARSVTVAFDDRQVSPVTLLSRLERMGFIALDLVDPSEWAELLAGELVPLAEDPRSLPGRLNDRLRRATGGAVDLFQVAVGVLFLSAGLQVRGALQRGEAVRWLRVVAFLLAAASIWMRHRHADAEP